MNSLSEVIRLINTHMDSIDKFHIKEIGVFGSFVRGEQTPESDVDILVKFEDNQETFDNYMDLKFYLEELFRRKVDVVIVDAIKDALKQQIVESAHYAKKS